ncbi:hypothetical protein CcaverHIS002_0507010 [Cutaneotrichosporon cavernicola]|uniref:S-adenosyl-L-methionine-dependent methyltransferase n=1 Tax=Cutaneotrichosporon cavernicola TaxID=279322 RepID=A0AA48L6U0_9TREE|nr:uncharacterized protein CcaverHIS019_0507540 [Cutaneotrichosporon cavernicola]BEI85300.1 hypothetical protein CcaverHIS002_0507010 [Cutaneotrichosporon cavernicola]BEI93126.1 hypothetical protein CcaverHIS019_0507540 [Cutaneotrichosporon cavernicola]BEJ00903.1 hypothetical protein CcaverHIS631_0507600 [Cutaneotrichosporon cavernicola]BEJ08669.1 hypothetical protein CcaverHIS641_0507630 [Cutaneotrichosporon cavernicola]
MRPTLRLLGCSPSSLLARLARNTELSPADAKAELRWMRAAAAGETALEAMVERRAAGEPLQYILGDTDFGPLTLNCRAPVLIPRPETAHIIERLASILPSRPLRVLDLCTGSGCIPLLLAHLRPDLTAVGVDISPDAIALSNENIAALGMGERVRVVQADILSLSFPDFVREEVGKVDLVTSNPPYIPQVEYDALPHSVRAFEDQRALLAPAPPGGEDGTAFYALIAKIAPSLLSEGEGVRVAVEIGAGQGRAVAAILPGRTEVMQDQYGRDRMVTAVF